MYHCSSISTGIYKEKGSKFLSFLHPCTSEQDVTSLRKLYQDKFYDARHICYALKYRSGNQFFERYSDAGEPNGTAGRPIAGQLEKFDLMNQMLIVVRYFGGTKLGTGGLTQAYKAAAEDAIKSAVLEEWFPIVTFKTNVGYEHADMLVNRIFEWQGTLIEKEFLMNCTFVFTVPESKSEEVAALLKTIAL